MVITTLTAIGVLYLLWVLYVFSMGVYRLHLRKELKGLNKFLSYPILFFALLTDFICNIWISILFIDLPREYLITQRLIRYKKDPLTWRGKIATYICDSALDLFDPTENHC